METLHQVQDQDFVEELAASMERNGWIGAPLVAEGDQLFTGVHRYAAAKLIDMVDYEIPTIEISEVFEEAGLDYHELHKSYGSPVIGECDFEALIFELPESIRDKYGIQFG